MGLVQWTDKKKKKPWWPRREGRGREFRERSSYGGQRVWDLVHSGRLPWERSKHSTSPVTGKKERTWHRGRYGMNVWRVSLDVLSQMKVRSWRLQRGMLEVKDQGNGMKQSLKERKEWKKLRRAVGLPAKWGTIWGW